MRFSAVETVENYLPGAFSARVLPFARKADIILAGADDASGAQRASLIAFSIRIASAGIAFFSQVALARMMGVFDYGIFVMVWVAMIIIGNLSCLGFQTVIIRFLPQYAESGDFDRVRGILKSSRLFVMFSSTVVAALTILAAYFGSQIFESYYLVPAILAALALPMIALADTLDGTARANGWPVRALGPTYLARPLLILVFLTIAWFAGIQINGTTGVICAVAATYVTTIGQLVLVTHGLDKKFPQGPSLIELNKWLPVALPIFLVEGFLFLLINADVLMVGILMDPENVAVYFATVKILALVHFVFFAVKAGVAHRFATLMAEKDRARLQDLARRSVTWTFWPSLAMGLIILLIGPLLLAMFGADFARGYPLLFILVSAVVIRSAIGPAESLLNMSGNQSACALVFGGVLVVNVTLNALFIPVLGLQGAALATFFAIIVEVFALFQLVRMRIGVSMSILSSAAKRAPSQ